VVTSNTYKARNLIMGFEEEPSNNKLDKAINSAEHQATTEYLMKSLKLSGPVAKEYQPSSTSNKELQTSKTVSTRAASKELATTSHSNTRDMSNIPSTPRTSKRALNLQAKTVGQTSAKRVRQEPEEERMEVNPPDRSPSPDSDFEDFVKRSEFNEFLNYKLDTAANAPVTSLNKSILQNIVQEGGSRHIEVLKPALRSSYIQDREALLFIQGYKSGKELAQEHTCIKMKDDVEAIKSSIAQLCNEIKIIRKTLDNASVKRTPPKSALQTSPLTRPALKSVPTVPKEMPTLVTPKTTIFDKLPEKKKIVYTANLKHYLEAFKKEVNSGINDTEAFKRFYKLEVELNKKK